MINITFPEFCFVVYGYFNLFCALKYLQELYWIYEMLTCLKCNLLITNWINEFFGNLII